MDIDFVPSLSSPVIIVVPLVGGCSPKALAKTSCKSFLLFPGPPEEVGLFSNCGLWRDILAFVGDANDGLRDADCGPSFRGAGIRLGVVGASIGMDVVGDVLRRFAAESAIGGI